MRNNKNNNKNTAHDKPNSRSNRRPYNDKRFSPRQKTQEDEKESGRSYATQRPTNDPSYYNKYPELVKDVASFWFSKPLGFPIKQFAAEAPYITTAPGICVLGYIPGPGVSKDAASAVNTVARAAYVFQRYVNSGSKTYEPADLMMYFLAMDSAYQWWAVGRRAIGLARLFSATNRYRAKELLKAVGFEPSIMDQLPRMRAIVNNFAARISSFAVPGSMDYFKRHAELCQLVYMDANSNKSQYYALVPEVYYEYQEEEARLFAHLQNPNTLMTLDRYEEILNTIAAPIVLSEDFGIMSGDVVKAYKDNIMRLTLTPDDYVTPVVYDEVMLSQIENAAIINCTAANIEQDRQKGSILYQPAVVGTQNLVYDVEPVINMHTDAPTADELMEATRFMAVPDSATDTVAYSGTEIVTTIYVWNFNNSGDSAVFYSSGVMSYEVSTGSSNPQFIDNANYNSIKSGLRMLTLLAQFHRHPRYFLVERIKQDDTNKATALAMSWEVENMVGIKEALPGIHETALLSLFNTGRIALN